MRGPATTLPATTRPTRLHALDAGFLALESPSTPMHFASVAYLDGEPLRDPTGRVRLEDLRRLVEDRLALAPRFRQQPRSAPLGIGRPVWVDDPDFDVADHVNEVVLPAPGTEEQLRDLCAHLMMRALPRSRPLWELWVVDGSADRSVVLLEKVHHVMMDGISGIDVAMLLTDATPEPTAPAAAAPASDGKHRSPVTAVEPAPSDIRLLAAGLMGDLGLERWLFEAPARAAGALAGAVRHPAGAARAATATVRRAGTLARGVGSLFTPGTVTPRTPLNRPVGRHRRYAHVEAPLGPLHKVAKAHGCTINDVVLAAVAGGVRRLRLERGEDPATPFQVAVPVSTRHPDEHLVLENRVAVYLVPLPVDLEDPVSRLEEVGAVSRRHKRQGQAELVSAVLATADRWPMAAVGRAARLLHRQPFANAVVTNVPGPSSTRYVLGARLRHFVPLVPLAANLDVSVGVLSYADELSFGCLADAEHCPDVATLAAGIGDTLAALVEPPGST